MESNGGQRKSEEDFRISSVLVMNQIGCPKCNGVVFGEVIMVITGVIKGK